MPLKLTAEQHEALEKTREQQIEVVDEFSNTAYVLVRANVFQQMQSYMEDVALTSAQVGMLIDEAMAEYDVGDPWLESYQRYRRVS